MAFREHAMGHCKKTVIALGLSLTIVCSGAARVFAGEADNELFAELPRSALSAALEAWQQQDPTIVESRYVLVDFDALSGEALPQGADVIVLNLFDDLSLTAVKERMERRSATQYTWFGRIEGVDHAQAILVVDGVSMAGNITVEGEIYQIRAVVDGLHAIREIDQSAFPDEAPPIPVDAPEGAGLDHLPAGQADDGSYIDVMVVYTEDVANASANIGAEIQLAIDETNASYSNSDIIQRVRLVHSEQVDYQETGNMSLDLSRLRAKGDGYMDDIHTLRDTYAADCVSLWVESGGYCGIAYFMDPVSPGFESSAFCVVARDCATGYYSFGHELGHNMSAHHDWYVNSGTTPFIYNHAYVNPEDRWRTIMAYNNECADAGFYCTRIQYWSNPDVTYLGDPTGVPGTTFGTAADNARTLDNTAYTVANFRQAAGVVSLELTPDTTTIPRGGTLGYTAEATNNTGSPQIFQYWTNVKLPGGSQYPPSGALFGPYTVTLGAYGSRSAHLEESVPAFAPLGLYTYNAYIGAYPSSVINEDHFDFVVVP